MRPRLAVERRRAGAVSRQLWSGLIRFNRKRGGSFDYRRTVIGARDAKGRLLGGLILQSYWRESYIELLWLTPRARGLGIGARLIEDAERRARLRGSRHIYLSTYSFQAPGFYETQGYRGFGTLSGSPKGERRYYYAKRLSRPSTASRSLRRRS